MSREQRKINTQKGIYEDLKAEGKTDKEVMEEMGIDHNKLYRWKKEWGITGKRGPTPKKESPVNKEKSIKEQVIQKVDESILKELEQENKTLKENYEQLQQEMDETAKEVEQLKYDKNKLMGDLLHERRKFQSLKEDHAWQMKAVHETCKDLSNELSEMKEKYQAAENFIKSLLG